MIEIDYKALVKRLEMEGVKFPISKWKLTKHLIDFQIAPNKVIAHRTILKAIQSKVLFSDMFKYNWIIDNIPDRKPDLNVQETKQDIVRLTLDKNGGRLRSAVLKKILVKENIFTTIRGAEQFIKRNIQSGVFIKCSYRRTNYLISFYKTETPVVTYVKDVNDIIVEETNDRIRMKDLKYKIKDRCELSYTQAALYVRKALQNKLIKRISNHKRNYYVIKV